MPDIPPIDPEANRYELWAQLVSEQPECEGCHRLMDGPQFAFDEYDPIGRWQTEIDGTPVQTAGVLEDVAGGSFEIAGRAELTQRLAELPDVSVCVVRQHLRFALRRELDVADECAVELLVAQLEDSGTSLRVLVREVALGEHFGLVRPM